MDSSIFFHVRKFQEMGNSYIYGILKFFGDI